MAEKKSFPELIEALERTIELVTSSGDLSESCDPGALRQLRAALVYMAPHIDDIRAVVKLLKETGLKDEFPGAQIVDVRDIKRESP